VRQRGADAALMPARLILTYTKVLAPADGYVTNTSQRLENIANLVLDK